MLFIQEKFESMLAAGASDAAVKYLKENRKWTIKGALSPMALTVEIARKRNIAKSHSRYQSTFSGCYLTSKDACKQCGKPAISMDHIIPHTRRNHVPAAAIRRIYMRTNENFVSVASFIKSWEMNGQPLCKKCNDLKALREKNVNWRDTRSIVKFYLTEKSNNIKGMDDTDIVREILASNNKTIIRAQRKIVEFSRKNNLAKRNGEQVMKLRGLWNTLVTKEKTINREIKAAGGTSIIDLLGEMNQKIRQEHKKKG